MATVKHAPGAPRLDWYFDFISPFSYLQHCLLLRWQQQVTDLEIHYVPVLFAGLLGHHGHKGPAEIPAKRLITYRHCHWLARRHNIPFAMPAAHPFNPLPMLRTAIAFDLAPSVIQLLFEHCWIHSGDNADFASIESIEKLPGLALAADLSAQQEVKSQLRRNTEQSVERGLFGVPTLAIDGDLFWGFDMTDMAMERLLNPELLNTKEYQRIGNLPIDTSRN